MQKTSGAFWFLIGALFLSLFWITRNDPFFGDAISSIARASNHIYFSNFGEIRYPKNLDPGHPLTFPLAHAALWSLFGRALWVSHLFQLTFGLLTIWLMVKWGKKEASSTSAFIAAAWLAVTPLFMSQSVNPNMHLPMTFFALGLGYSLKFNKTWGQFLFSLALVISHLQGLYYLTPLWLWWFFTSNSPIKERIGHGAKLLTLPAILFLAWLYYHQSITGWALSSPDYAGHRGFPGIKRFVVNLILSDWRMVDYGQIAFFVLPCIALIKGKAKWSKRHPMVVFLTIYLFNALALAVTTKTGPMHRYLLPCLPFIILANLDYLDKLGNWKKALLSLVLLSGHFWFYPGKVMGDATLAYRNIFPLLKEAKEEFGHPVFHTYAPLSNPEFDTYLGTSKTDYRALYSLELEDAHHVIVSNISGDFSQRELNTLHSNWPVKTYERRNVYLEVYSNPEKVKHPITGPKRKIGKLEQWIIWLKHKIKGKDSV